MMSNNDILVDINSLQERPAETVYLEAKHSLKLQHKSLRFMCFYLWVIYICWYFLFADHGSRAALSALLDPKPAAHTPPWQRGRCWATLQSENDIWITSQTCNTNAAKGNMFNNANPSYMVSWSNNDLNLHFCKRHNRCFTVFAGV